MMVFTPTDIVKILTAAAPIAASVASISKSEIVDKKKDSNDKEEPKICVTINNIFYTNSEYDARNAANTIYKQMMDSINNPSSTRYTL